MPINPDQLLQELDPQNDSRAQAASKAPMVDLLHDKLSKNANKKAQQEYRQQAK